MDKPFRRASHRTVAGALAALDAAFLAANGIYFGGGTRIVLELDEYRESRDIDFLCASRPGYRTLREAVSATSLGPLARGKALKLDREIRADQYGVRTWLALAGLALKFEIVRESRIDLQETSVAGLPVPCLDRPHAFAEKFLANADRGLDASTLSRDAIDLAFMVLSWGTGTAAQGAAIAREAYGKEVDRKLGAVVQKLRGDRKYRTSCIDGMAIEDTRTLAKGLELLARGAA
jgi:hypothetical protein